MSQKVLSVFFYILFLLCNLVIIAQDKDVIVETIDVDKIYKLPVKEVKSLISNTFNTDKDLCLEYCTHFLKRGINQKNYTIQQYANKYLSYINYYQSKYEKALVHTNAAISAGIKIPDSLGMVDNYILRGGIQFRLSYYSAALESYIKAEEIAVAKSLKSKELICEANIGFIKAEMQRYSHALDSFESILSKLEKEDYKEAKEQFTHIYASVILSKGLCLRELGRLDEALATNQQGIALANTHNLNGIKGNFYINTGNTFYQKKEYYNALGHLNEGIKILESIESPNLSSIFLARFYSAQCFFELERYQEALDLLSKNFNVVKENDFQKTDQLDKMYELAIQIAEKRKDKDLIISLNKEYRNVLHAMSNDQLKARDAIYDRDISNLKIDNKRLENQYDQKKFITTVSIGIAIMLLLLLVIGGFMFKMKSRKNEKLFRELTQNFEEKRIEIKQKSKKQKHIKDEKVNSILEKLENLQDSSFFLSKECNLYTTAKKINTNTSYLSKTLNKYKKQSFNQYLNELRVHHVMLKLQDDIKFRSYTIEAIAREVGYKSSNTFVKVFKDKTNLNPSYYIKRLNKNPGS